MENNRPSAARWMRCSTNDAHDGAVEHAVWVNGGFNNGGGFFATGGADGKVKIWDAKRAACLWTSEIPQGQLLRDPCVKVAVDACGVVATVYRSGITAVWSGLGGLFAEEQKEVVPAEVHEVRTTPPPAPGIANPYGEASQRQISSFYMHRESPTAVSLLTAYEGESCFYRSSIDFATDATERVAFGDTSMGAISVLHPVFAEQVGEHSFVVTGDRLGSVSIFPWDGRPTPISSDTTSPAGAPTALVLPTRRFEAHTEGAVTAIAWTPAVILTGSSIGSIKAFDSLTFAPLRDFTSASRTVAVEDVMQIIVERDFFAASIGNRVVAWRGEPVGKADHGYTKGKRVAKTPNGIAKWHRTCAY